MPWSSPPSSYPSSAARVSRVCGETAPRHVHMRRMHPPPAPRSPPQSSSPPAPRPSTARWPLSRDGHSCTYVGGTGGGSLVVFGGKHEPLRYLHDTDTLRLDSLSWEEGQTGHNGRTPSTSSTPSTAARPPLANHARCNHASVLYRGRILVFGGYVGLPKLCYFNDLLIYDTAARRWSRHSHYGGTGTDADADADADAVVPPPRSEHTMVLKWDHGNPQRDSLVLFGGYCGTGYYSDMWELSLQHLTWKRVRYDFASVMQWPSPIASHSAVVRRNGCAHNAQRMVVFAGDAFGETTNSLYQFQFDTRMWEPIYPSPGDAQRGRNGSGGSGRDNDSSNASESGDTLQVVPCARRGHSAVMLNRLDQMMIFGGYNDNITADDADDSRGIVSDLCDCFLFDFQHRVWMRLEFTMSPLYHTCSLGLDTVLDRDEIQRTSQLMHRSYHQMVLLEDEYEKGVVYRREHCGTERMAVVMGFDSVVRLDDVCFLELQTSEEKITMQQRLWESQRRHAGLRFDCEIVTFSSVEGTEVLHAEEFRDEMSTGVNTNDIDRIPKYREQQQQQQQKYRHHEHQSHGVSGSSSVMQLWASYS